MPHPRRRRPKRRQRVINKRGTLKRRTRMNHNMTNMRNLQRNRATTQRIPRTIRHKMNPPRRRNTRNHTRNKQSTTRRQIRHNNRRRNQTRRDRRPRPRRILKRRRRNSNYSRHPYPRSSNSPPRQVVPRQRTRTQGRSGSPTSTLLPRGTQTSNMPLLNRTRRRRRIPRPIMRRRTSRIRSPRLIRGAVTNNDLQFREDPPSLSWSQRCRDAGEPPYGSTREPRHSDTCFSSQNDERLDEVTAGTTNAVPLSPRVD